MELTKNLSPWEFDAWDSIPPLLHGKTIGLIHEADLANVPDGTLLLSVFGHPAIVGAEDSEIDNDTRGGYLSFGLPVGYGWPDQVYLEAYCRQWHAGRAATANAKAPGE